jgi:hypothetical protein
MLFDEVLASPAIKAACGENYDQFRRWMLQAQRFDLSQPFATAVDEIAANNPMGWVSAAQTVRAPHTLSWFEVAQSFRPAFMAGPGTDHKTAEPVKRVGVFAIEHDGELVLTLFWSFRDGAKPAQFSMVVNCLDFSAEGRGRAQWPDYSGQPYFHPEIMFGGMRFEDCFTISVNAFLPEPTIARIMERPGIMRPELLRVSAEDWSGELQFWATALMLLNSRNIGRTVSLPADVKHKRGVLAGKYPVDTFKVCHLHERIAGWTGKTADPREHESAIRAHFVRGHFKVRKSGVYWWSPFVRGNRDLGTVHKTYEVA